MNLFRNVHALLWFRFRQLRASILVHALCATCLAPGSILAGPASVSLDLGLCSDGFYAPPETHWKNEYRVTLPPHTYGVQITSFTLTKGGSPRSLHVYADGALVIDATIDGEHRGIYYLEHEVPAVRDDPTAVAVIELVVNEGVFAAPGDPLIADGTAWCLDLVYDYWAPTENLVALDLRWSAGDGGVDFRYGVFDKGFNLMGAVAELYWADPNEIVGAKPIYSERIYPTFKGISPQVHVPEWLLSCPPPEASHLLLLVFQYEMDRLQPYEWENLLDDNWLELAIERRAIVGRVLDAATHLPLPRYVVSLGTVSSVTSAAGEYVLNVPKQSCTRQLRVVDPDGNEVALQEIEAGGALDRLVVPDIHVSRQFPAITSVVPLYDGLFLSGVTLRNRYTATVNWGPARLGWIKCYAGDQLFQLQPGSAGTDDPPIRTAVFEIDVAAAFPSSSGLGPNRLRFVAEDADGGVSKPFELQVGMIPFPNWVLPMLQLPFGEAVEVIYDRGDPSYSMKLDFGNRLAPPPALVRFPHIGALGMEFSLGGGLDYLLTDGGWQLHAGLRGKGRYSSRVPASGRGAWNSKAYLGSREVEVSVDGFAEGIASQTKGIRADRLGLKVGAAFKGEIGRLYFTDALGAPWARTLDAFERIGADINSIQRVKLFGSLDANAGAYYQLAPPGGYGGTVGLGLGLEAEYAPNLGVAKGRVYGQGKAAEVFEWPSKGDFRIKSAEAALLCGWEFTAFGIPILKERMTLVKCTYPPLACSGPVLDFAAVAPEAYTWIAGEPWELVAASTAAPGSRDRSYLLSGSEGFTLDAASPSTPLSGEAQRLTEFRTLGRAGKGPPARLTSFEGGTPAGLEPAPRQVDLSLVENTYPEAEPALARGRSDDLMLLWVADSGADHATQFTDIHWSYYDGETWSRPAPIHPDPRAECAPQVAFDGQGDAVAVWLRTSDPEQSGLDVLAFASTLEVVWSRWSRAEGRWSKPEPLTQNAVVDHSPRLAGPLSAEDGRLLCVWTQNQANRLLGGVGEAADQVLSAWWDPAKRTWSAPQAFLPALSHRLSQSLAGAAGGAIYTWAQDLDGDLTTAQDQEIFFCEWRDSTWSAPERLTTNKVVDRNVRVAGTPPAFVWQQDSALVRQNLGAGGPTVLRPNSDGVAFADYVVCGGPAGQLVLVWQQQSESGSDMHYAVFDPRSQRCSRDTPLTRDGAMERAPATLIDSEGNLIVAHQKVEMRLRSEEVVLGNGSLLTIENLAEPGRSDLVITKRLLVSDPALDPAGSVLEGNRFLPGDTVTFKVNVANRGDFAVSNLTVEFHAGTPGQRGILITNLLVSGIIEGGNNDTVISVPTTLWGRAEPRTFYATLVPHPSMGDFATANNEVAVTVGGTDLTVRKLSHQAAADGSLRIVAEVENRGAPAAPESWLALRREGEVGPPLVTTPVPALDPGHRAQVILTLPAGSPREGEVVYWLTADETRVVADVIPGNNAAPFAVFLWGDQDRDGMPDGWEAANGFSPSDPNDSALDPDGDGASNLAEFQAGTDPHDRHSNLRVTAAVPVNAEGVRISWTAAPNRRYTVQRTTDLSEPFIEVARHLDSTPPVNEIIDKSAVGDGPFFYRLKLE